MTTKVAIAGTDISAPQMMHFFELAGVQGSHVNRDTFQAYLECRDPFTLERNKYGHVVITFQGLDLTGAQEIVRLKGNGYNVLPYATQCLLSTATDSYDSKHRLVTGHKYKIALMPGSEIKVDTERTTLNLRKRGMERYEYGEPLAGHIPRIREKVSDKKMEEIGTWYIASLHDPIVSGGDPRVLNAFRGGDGRNVDADWDEPSNQWNVCGCFAFPVPQAST